MDKKILLLCPVASNYNGAMINVNFYLKNYLRRDGTQQIIIQLTTQGQRKRLPVPVYVLQSDWDKNKQRIRATAENAAGWNLVLDDLRSKITNIKITYQLNKMPLTLERLIEEIKDDTPNVNFISFCRLHSSQQKLAAGTRRKEAGHLNKLERFKNNLFFNEINVVFLDRYRNHLFKIGNNRNTVNSNFKTICKYINLAKKYGFRIDVDTADIETKYIKSNRTFLDVQEIGRLKEYYFSSFISAKHKLVLGYFLFSCFTGCRLSEILIINRMDTFAENLSYFAPKTGKQIVIQLNQNARKIVEHHPELFVRFISEQKINDYLKECMRVVGIRKKISFHCSRHSFATNFLRLGGKVEELKTLLGHADIKTTMIYVHQLEAQEIDNINLLDQI